MAIFVSFYFLSEKFFGTVKHHLDVACNGVVEARDGRKPLEALKLAEDQLDLGSKKTSGANAS